MARIRRRIPRREIKEDRFILWLFDISGKLDKNKNKLVTVILATLLVFGGSYYWFTSQAVNLVEVGKVFAPGYTAMQTNRYQDAIPIFERVVAEYRGSDLASEAMLELANAYFYIDDYINARKYYQTFLNEHGGQDNIWELTAQSGLAACDEEEKHYERAATQYLSLADQNPGSHQVPMFLLDAARCYKSAGKNEQAISLYKKVISSYQTTSYARDAQIAMTSL
tara:strand:+ start:18691 stop:19362 length:672 start_codon:yes stop_codon:yes gene_type:complete